MELNSQFTKEQLITHITRHSDEINRLIKQQSHHDNEYRKKLLAVNEIALKALMAEPVAWTDEQELRGVERDGCGYLFTVNPVTPNADPRRVIKLYAEPPAPVVIKDHQFRELVTELRDIAADYHGTHQLRERIAYALRAAMLKGGAK